VDAVVETYRLRKRYPGHEALRGVDLHVPPGTVLGLLGHNGAGKTTTIRILATLLAPGGGSARVAGFDVAREPQEVRRRIALAGQYAAVDAQLTGRENLVLLGRLLRLGTRGARARAGELLERFDLTAAADRQAGTYSGGMRRRLDLACCLVTRPAVLFLDEPSAGLDPASRRLLWTEIREQVRGGITVVLTTQYLEEADQLADRIVVLGAGSVVAEGSPEQLKRDVGGEWLEVSVADPSRVGEAREILASVAGSVESTDGKLSAPIPDGTAGIAAVAGKLHANGIAVQDFALRRPSLDDVFFALTRTSEAV